MFERLYIFLMFIPILAVHECAHAWMAHKCGDDTAKEEGRLTLNPASHIDLWGTLIIPAINILLPGAPTLIGWGRPVPVDVRNLRHRRMQELLIAMAGPVSNFLLAAVALAVGQWALSPESRAQDLVQTFAYVSVFLGVFNLLPVPPLDGWRVARSTLDLPEEWEERGGIWWFLALLVLINLPPVMNLLRLLSQIILQLIAWPLGA